MAENKALNLQDPGATKAPANFTEGNELLNPLEPAPPEEGEGVAGDDASDLDAEAAESEEDDLEIEQPEPTDPKANVYFVGTRRRNGKKVRLTEAPAKLISGPETFDNLPSSEEQLNGFYYERAAELCRAFPGLYKRLIKKGE